MRSLFTKLLPAVALSIALGATAAFAAQPDPGPDWMLEGKPAVRYNFVPDADAGSPIDAGLQGSRTNSFTADGNKRTSQAREVSAQKAMSLTNSTAVKAAGGGKVVDISRLVYRLGNGPVDFGEGGKPYFQLSASTSGGSDTVTFRAYKGSALQSGAEYVVHISGNGPTATTGTVYVSLALVSKDGSTIDGVFRGPNGQTAKLNAQ